MCFFAKRSQIDNIVGNTNVRFTINVADAKSIAFLAAVFSSVPPSHVWLPSLLAMLGTIARVAYGRYGSVALPLSHGGRLHHR
jgi:hypothetical protein